MYSILFLTANFLKNFAVPWPQFRELIPAFASWVSKAERRGYSPPNYKKEAFMKSAKNFPLLFLLVFGFIGCDTGNSTPETNSTPEETIGTFLIKINNLPSEVINEYTSGGEIKNAGISIDLIKDEETLGTVAITGVDEPGEEKTDDSLTLYMYNKDGTKYEGESGTYDIRISWENIGSFSWKNKKYLQDQNVKINKVNTFSFESFTP
jgi:hypothetical protein